jgi:competence protein ComEC
MATPLFPVMLAFCAGIVLAKFVTCPISHLLLVCSFFVCLSWLLFLAARSWLLNGILLFASLSMGMAWPSIYEASYGPNHLKNLVRSGRIDLSQPCRVTGVCSKNSVQREIGEQIEMDVDRIENRYSVIPTRGKIRLALYYQKQTSPVAGRINRPINIPSEPIRPGDTPSAGSPSWPIMSPGDRVEVLANLRQPKNFADPGQFDYVSHLERQGVFLVGIIKNELLVIRIAKHQSSRLMSLVQKLRANLENSLNQPSYFSEPVRAALKALLLGQKQGLDPQLEQAFQASGIYHVLVVSGQHVAILAGFLLGLFGVLRFPRSLAILVTMMILALYCLLTESQPSVVRATLMTCSFLIVLTFDRDRNLLNSLSLAALLLLLIDPFWLFDSGFLLSFLAVLAIGLIGIPIVNQTTRPYRDALWQIEEPSLDSRFAPRLADFRLSLRLKMELLQQWFKIKSTRLVRWALLVPLYGALSLADVLLISVSIQTLFFVLMIVYFHRVSLISIFLNALVVPVVGLIVPLGFVFLALFSIAAWAGAPMGLLCAWLTKVLLASAKYFADPAWGNYRMATPSLWLVLAYLFCLLLSSVSLVKRTARIGLAGLATVAAILPAHPAF